MTCPPRGPVSWGKWEKNLAHSPLATRLLSRAQGAKEDCGQGPPRQAALPGFKGFAPSPVPLILLHGLLLLPGGPFLPPLLVNFYLPSRTTSNVTSSEKPPVTPPAQGAYRFFGFLFPLLCV